MKQKSKWIPEFDIPDGKVTTAIYIYNVEKSEYIANSIIVYRIPKLYIIYSGVNVNSVSETQNIIDRRWS